MRGKIRLLICLNHDISKSHNILIYIPSQAFLLLPVVLGCEGENKEIYRRQICKRQSKGTVNSRQGNGYLPLGSISVMQIKPSTETYMTLLSVIITMASVGGLISEGHTGSSEIYMYPFIPPLHGNFN